jgi:putative transposase
MVGYDRVMHTRQPYPTDLSDKEGALINHLVPEAKPGGRPEAYPKREILNAIFDLLRSGCSWRMLPHDLPPWRPVYHDFRTWCQDGTWQIRHDLLRRDVRVAAGKQRQPSAGIVDSQSVKTTAKGGPTGTMPTNTSTAAHGISSSTR